MATELTTVGGEQAIFIVPDDGPQIEVKISGESVWLTPAQMSALFGRELSVIHRHIRNVFAQGEVPEDEGYRQNLPITSQAGGRPEVAFNLDVIISVGYRVKSKHGVEFRQWATRVLKEKLLKDYRDGAQESKRYLSGLKNIAILAQRSSSEKQEDPAAVLSIIERYARSWNLLLQYDEGQLPPPSTKPTKRMARLTLHQASRAIDRFRRSLAEKGETTELFGKVRTDGLASILGNLEQTWGGKPVYLDVPTRAAHLLYFVIKDHPFFDGNKRIGSLLFLVYLDKNDRATRQDRTPLFDDNAMVALALLIAESDPKHKDIIIRLIINLIDGGER